MPYQTDLLSALRDWGLTVIEVNGCRTRGSSSFNPGGSVNHHVAGSRRGSMPSLRILTEGRSGLPGPLCNVGQSRSTEYHPDQEYDDVYLIAAGRANHAGEGGWRGLRGNSSVFGLEIEHTGNLSTEPWPERRAHTAYRVHRAFMDVGGFTEEYVCQHKEWAPSRKIDFIGADGSAFRAALAEVGDDWMASSDEILARVVSIIERLDGEHISTARDTNSWIKTLSAQIKPDELAAQIAKAMPAGTANAAEIEKALRKVFADAGEQ